MPKVRLTDLTIRSLKPPDAGQVDYWCDQLAGFGLRVSQGGSRAFVVKHNNQRQTLGRWPTLSLQNARAEARQLMARDALGIKQPQAQSFDDALELYVEQYVRKKLRASTAYEKERLLRKNVMPFLGSKNLHEIEPQQIIAITDKFPETTAVHVHQAMRAFFRWCMERHMLDKSPCVHLKLPGRIVSRSRLLTDAEIARIYKACIEIGYPFGYICLTLIHTGMRRGEVGGLRWSWITKETITLPASATKNHRELVLPNLINDNLELVPKTSEFVFPSSTKESGYAAWSDGKKILDHLCGVENFVIHDFRRYFSSTMSRLRVPIDVTEAMLNHVSGSRSEIQRTYDRHDRLPEMREALELYETHLKSITKL